MNINKGLAFIGVAIAIVGMAYCHVDGFCIMIVSIAGFFFAAVTR